jgi:hypothetical protein
MLCSHTVDISEDGVDFKVGVNASDWQCEQQEVLGSADEHVEGTETNLGQPNIIKVMVEPTDFHSCFANMLAAMKENNKALQDSIADNNAKLQENL